MSTDSPSSPPGPFPVTSPRPPGSSAPPSASVPQPSRAVESIASAQSPASRSVPGFGPAAAAPIAPPTPSLQPSAPDASLTDAELEVLAALRQRVVGAVGEVIVGQHEIVDGMLIALMAQGHALLEGVPGTAKTLMVRALSAALGLDFGRVQFTPDLMPSDIVGTNVFHLHEGTFRLTQGPIFTELLLADEINRAPAKTQSALLEAMQERQVSIDGTTHPLSQHFTVFATQNPVEQEGTYPLPEAQLDRFLLKLHVGYPSEEEEDQILAGSDRGFQSSDDALARVSPVVSATELVAARALAQRVRVEDDVRRYLRDLVRATRRSPLIQLGAGPRAGVHLLVAARWSAALLGRPFVTPDDVQRMLDPVLGHRLALSPEMELDGTTAGAVLDRVARSIEVPR